MTTTMVSENEAYTEYWNNVADAASDFETKIIKDNFDKKRQIAGELLKKDLSKEKILELGTGNGLIAGIVKWANGRVDYTGLDVSPRFAKTANEFFGLNVVVGRSSSLPFPDGSNFTVIFAFDVLEHIPFEERAKTYEELNRVLHPERRVVFINNPLENAQVSRHDPAYDYGFDERDLGEMVKTLGMIIATSKIIESNQYKRRYQFITLVGVEMLA